MDDTIKLVGAILGLAGTLGGVMAWMTKVLIPRLLDQFKEAQQLFLNESKQQRHDYLASVTEIRKEAKDEGERDRRIRHETNQIMSNLSTNIACLNQRLDGGLPHRQAAAT